MASTVLVKDVLWRASVLLQDNAPQFARWSEQELVNWLQDAQIALAKFFPQSASRIDTIKLKAGSRQSIDSVAAADVIPGDGVTLVDPILGIGLLDLIRNMGADGTTPGKAIRMTERRVLDAQTPMWHSIAGKAVSSFMYDPEFPKYFYITPALDAPKWVEIAWTAMPRAIPNTGAPGSELYAYTGTSTTKVSVGDENADDLVNYIVARANMKDVEWADGNKAQVFSQLFLGSLNARVAALTGTNPNLKSLPFAPEPLGRAAK